MKGLWCVRFLCLVCLLAAMPAGATGPKKLKQPSSLPIIINTPGSYILESNLTVPDANTTAISVQADNVTIDLNGFSILGPCTGNPPCSPTGSGKGIDGLTATKFNTTVLNGTVQGMGAAGITLNNGRVTGVSVVLNGGAGINITTGTVTGCQSIGNGSDGINATVVSNCLSAFNIGNGIAATLGAVTGCVSSGNGVTAISAPGVSHTNICDGSTPCP